MKLIGNIIWIVFGGLLLALEYFILGIVWCISIIGIPIGLQLFKIAGLSLWPFGKVVRHKQQTIGCLSTGLNILWFLLGGILLALEHAIIGLFFFITIIGIPFGKQHFKLAAIALSPFGKEIMSVKKSKRLALANGMEDSNTIEESTDAGNAMAADETELETDNEGSVRSFPSLNVTELLSDIPAEKMKPYAIVGCAVVVLAVLIGIFTCSGTKKGSGMFAGKPISELFPEVEKVADDGNIPDEPLTFIWDNSQGEECGGDVTVVRKKDENQMVVMYETTSCDANMLRLGTYQKGQYVFYYEIPVGGLDYDETKTGISLQNNEPESVIYYGYYGKDVATTKTYEEGYTTTELDWDKVTEAQLAEIFAKVIVEGPKDPLVITSKYIKEAKSNDNQDFAEEAPEDPEITTALDELEEQMAAVEAIIEECEENKEKPEGVYDGIVEARDLLSEKEPQMTDEQKSRFETINKNMEELIRYANRVYNFAIMAEEADSTEVEE